MDARDDAAVPRVKRCLKSRLIDERRTDLQEGEQTRGELLRRAEEKVREYGQLLLQSQKLVAMNRPSDPDYNSVRNYMEGRSILFEDSSEFIYEREDLVTLRPGRECAWLDAFVERVLKAIRWEPITRLFRTEDLRSKSTDQDICYFSRTRISALCTSIISVFILILLVVPIYALYQVSKAETDRSSVTCIGVLLVAALIFSIILSLFIKAMRNDILGASAAYCAVLVVFVGGVGSH